MTFRSGARLALHVLPGIVAIALYTLVVVPVVRLRRRKRRAPAILWAPVPITNIHYSARADRLAGYSSTTLVYRVYRPGDRGLYDHVLDRYTRIRGLGQLVPYAVFLWAGLRFDIFGFFFDGGLLGETPFWRYELPLLRLAGKRTVVYPYGGDARIASVMRAHGGWHALSDVPPGAEDRDEDDVRARVEHVARWADVVLGFNDLVGDLPRHDGVLLQPFDAESWQPVDVPPHETVRVVHAPNHRHYKGTRFVIEAVERLRAEGLPVELVLVEGVPNAEARAVYEQADVVAEQFLIGNYALFGVEAMALGKPVLCYLSPRLAPFHPEWRDCPVVNADPETLVDELRALVLDRERRAELGRRGRSYALAYHSLASAAAQLEPIYRRLWGHEGASAPAVERPAPER